MDTARQKPLQRQRGSALIIVAVLLALTVFTISSLSLSEQSYLRNRLILSSQVQATNAARAGLAEALNWFRRQPAQPVASPDPAFPDIKFHPSGADTVDETLGLVKQYKLSEAGSLCARFELLRNTASGPTPHTVRDVTHLHDPALLAGSIWSLESHGYIFRCPAGPDVLLTPSVNTIVAQSRIFTEIQRLPLQPPNAAVTIGNANNLSLLNLSRIQGNTTNGVLYATGSPPASGITGNPIANTIASPPSTQQMFGVEESAIRRLADIVLTSPDQLPKDPPPMVLIYAQGPITFDGSHPLNATGILYVSGDLVVAPSNNSVFNGIIFVNGNATIQEPFLLAGAITVTGTLTLDGGAADAVDIEYHQEIIQNAIMQIGQYRTDGIRYEAASAQQ